MPPKGLFLLFVRGLPSGVVRAVVGLATLGDRVMREGTRR